jgi:hypothetical protein
MHAEASRRALIGAMVGLPIVAAVAAIPAPAAATKSDWPGAYARWQAADAAWDDHTAKIYNPAVEILNDLEPTPPGSFTHVARNGQSATYYIDRSNPTEWDGVPGIIGRLGKQTQDAFFAWNERQKAKRQEIGFSAIEDEDVRLCDVMVEARKAAVSTRVASLSELAEKADFISDQYGDSVDDWIFDEIRADIRHLVTEGR